MSKKHVCITGATRGLGRALVENFHAMGWRISGCGSNSGLVFDLREAFPDNQFEICNVTQPNEVQAFAQAILNDSGCPDLLINNAAVINQPAPIWEAPLEEINLVVDVNIKGVIYVMQQFLPSMIKRGSGVVANLSSGWGRSTSAGVALYCSTKWAIEGLSQATAQDLPTGVTCTAVNPGIINTEMLSTSFGASASASPSAEEWVESAAPFFAGLDASCNGKSLTVPGAVTS